MSRLKGKVVFRDLGPGTWELVTPDGQRLQLDGGPFRDGESVTVEGDVDDAALGIGMTGAPTLRVRKIER